jgi:hypothetical protein
LVFWFARNFLDDLHLQIGVANAFYGFPAILAKFSFSSEFKLFRKTVLSQKLIKVRQPSVSKRLINQLLKPSLK